MLNRGVEGASAVLVDGAVGAPPPAAPEDRASVPSVAWDLAQLDDAARPVDEIRTEKVARIRNALATGAYSADPLHVARDFLRDILSQLLR